MAKNNFLLYKDFDPTLDLLDNEQAGKLFKALYKYVNGRNEPNFTDGMLIVAFNMLKTQLERDLEKYQKRVSANVENGKLGGRPKKKPKEPTGLKKTQQKRMKAEKGDSVSGSVSDSDLKDKKIYKKSFLEFVKLTEIEHNKLLDKFGNDKTNDLIERLNNYIGSKGTKYKSHYHTILSWNRKDILPKQENLLDASIL